MDNTNGPGANSSAFALTGVYTRGGLSNWVLFFYPTELVLIDLGAGPSIKAGALMGAGAQFGVLGYAAAQRMVSGSRAGKAVDIEKLRGDLEPKAKRIERMSDSEISCVQIRLTMMQHHFQITATDGTVTKYGVLTRQGVEAAAEPLSLRFGSRFQLHMTSTYAFLKEKAPFLVR